ncbi:MAG: PfkB family carbohydrate kinase [Candidatus Hydrogenedentes bacterium]|nr:PfkB family carbohydrate kinase [Candidatus Hydrogenedentota bacterium]
MSITVVGSVALDTVETSEGRNDEGLGGAATYFALAAANFTEVNLVGVVGDDFPDQHVELLAAKGINLEGLERAPGRTFRWTGKYHEDMNNRDTLETQLNVFEHFHPKLPDAARKAPFLFLGNIHPSLQLEVLDQAKPRFVGLDTMNLWINIARDELEQVLRRVDVIIINDSEVKLLTGENNLIRGVKAVRALGPRIVVMKKGEHGCMLFSDDDVFSAPAYPLENLCDPTGAGDTFAGGFLGHLAGANQTDNAALRRAVIYGSVAASFTCEKFGPDRLAEIDRAEIDARFGEFQRLAKF